MPPRARHTAALLLLLIAAAIFSVRTVLKPGERLWDFSICALSARAYLNGENPYDHAVLEKIWRAEASPAAGVTPPTGWLYAIVPPPVLLALTPFAAMPSSIAQPLWMAFSLGLLGLAIAAAASLARIRFGSAAWFVLFAGVLLLGPAQSVIHAGQPAGPAISLIVIAIWCIARPRSRRGTTTIAGEVGRGDVVLPAILLTLAIALKAQLALPFVALLLLRSPRKAGLLALCFSAIFIVLSLVPLQARGIPWTADWTRNIRDSSATGQPNDYSTANSSRDHLLNLQMPGYAMSQNRMLSEIVAISVTAILGFVWLWLALRRTKPKFLAGEEEGPSPLLLPAAALGVIILLPVYHRYYDATILMLPLAWALAALHRQRRLAVVVLALLIPFVLPVGWQTNLAARAPLPTALTKNPFWTIGVSAMQSWLALAVGVTLLWAMRGSGAKPQAASGNF